jgi:hypothetical protein
MYHWMRFRLIRPFGTPSVVFMPGEWPTVYAPRMNRTVTVEGRPDVVVPRQNRTINDPRMGGPRP